MDEILIVELYEKGDSMRSIADKLGTNHKLISRVLKKGGIQTRKPKSLRGVKKFSCDIERIITIWPPTYVLMFQLNG